MLKLIKGQTKLHKYLSKSKENQVYRPSQVPSVTLGVHKLHETSNSASGLVLGTLLDLILKAHHGLEGFPNGFGTGLKRAFLENLIFKGCL